jgi:hypothetical protein
MARTDDAGEPRRSGHQGSHHARCVPGRANESGSGDDAWRVVRPGGGPGHRAGSSRGPSRSEYADEERVETMSACEAGWKSEGAWSRRGEPGRACRAKRRRREQRGQGRQLAAAGTTPKQRVWFPQVKWRWRPGRRRRERVGAQVGHWRPGQPAALRWQRANRRSAQLSSGAVA